MSLEIEDKLTEIERVAAGIHALTVLIRSSDKSIEEDTRKMAVEDMPKPEFIRGIFSELWDREFYPHAISLNDNYNFIAERCSLPNSGIDLKKYILDYSA